MLPEHPRSFRLPGPTQLLSRRSFWLLVALLAALAVGTDILARLFWFEALGYDAVFWRILLLKSGLFIVAAVVAYAYLLLNLVMVSRRVGAAATPYGSAGVPWLPVESPILAALRSPNRWLLPVAALVPAVVIGLVAANGWDTVLRFVWAQPFGRVEPVFGHDLGFYVFSLPLLELVQNVLTTMALLALLVLAAVYRRARLLNYQPHIGLQAPRPVRRQLAANIDLLLLAWAAGCLLDRYALLVESSGAVFGAGYTDVVVTRHALVGAAGSIMVFAALLHWSLATDRVRLVPYLVGGFLAALVWFLVALPFFVQRFVVVPNELELEAPYLERNIAFTRDAYDLAGVTESAHDPRAELDLATIQANRPTIDNIRLWDWQPLTQTFRQLQQIRTYYVFHHVDVDRYRLGGDYRQVLLSARELAEDLPGTGGTWVNRRLQYTHGFGLVMTPAADKTPDGRPVLTVKDLPPRSPPDLPIVQPAIYHGEEDSGYRIVATRIPEFDHPRGDENVYARYAGHGGVPIGSQFRRIVYALHKLDLNIVLSGYLTADSRIQFWRSVQDRVARIAPFLWLDSDPYLVVDQGRLFWIQDAYTTASGYPYAEPVSEGFSYIRNSLKVVIDAYDGDVTFYVVEPEDPVLRVYRAAFPAMFRPIEAMPEGLVAHLRYPQDLFQVQLRTYAKYHMTVPQVFYNSEDLWATPMEKYGGATVAMEPYYVLVRLPGEERLEFLLMSPLTPARRDNMIAWMAARADAPHYGELLVYRLPKERLVLGPMQLEAMINQDTTISRQISLWDQHGSRVLRGNLLVIPIGNSFLYVEPVYLSAEGNDLPQLKRIIVSDGGRLAMEPTLGEALRAAFGGATREDEGGEHPSSSAGLDQARRALDDAEAALRDGNWPRFGAAMQELKTLLGPGAQDGP
jgi:uncharacterized membrane protein (UPF0182 family)